MNESTPPEPSGEPAEYELEVEAGGWQRFGWWLRTWKGIVCALTALLLVLAVGNARALYDGAKRWRAGRLIAQSEKAGRAKNFAEQFKLLRQAFVIAPSTPLTIRAAARFHEARGEPAALPLYESLIATKDATTEDKIRACRLGFNFGKIDFSRKLLEELRADATARVLPRVTTLEAQLAATEGKWAKALELGRKAAADPAATGEDKLVLAALLTKAGGSGAEERAKLHAEAIDVFASLVDSPEEAGAQSIAALVSLARDPAAASLLAGRDVAAWVEAAARHPGLAPRMRVAAWDLLLTTRKADAAGIVSAFLEKWRESPLEERLEAARWLNQRGKSALSLQLSEPQRDTSADWFLVYLDGLASLGRWDSVLKDLRNPTGAAEAMAPALRAVFIMRARSELGEKFDKAEAWRDIQIQLPGETVQNQLFIANYAEKVGEAKQAASVFRRLIEESGGGTAGQHELSREEKFACYSGVIRLTPENAPAEELLPWFDRLSAEFPELAEAANDAIYLRLLTGETKPAMRARLAELLGKNPAVLAYRTTCALLELRAKDATAAAKLYEGWQIDWATAPDRYKAVRVAVFEAAGKKEEAQKLRATADPKRLRPEEIKLLGAWP